MKAIAALSFLCCSCVATGQLSSLTAEDPGPYVPSIQGFIGVMDLSTTDYGLAQDFGLDSESEAAQFPVMGFVLAQALTGEGFRIGVEGGMSASWDNDSLVVDDGAGSFSVVENDLFLADAFIGVHVVLPVGERLRFYAGAGPLAQLAHVESNFDFAGERQSPEETALGLGVYGRVGFEWEFAPGNRAGLFIRRVESSVDFGGNMGEVDLDGHQIVFGLSQLY